MVLKFEIGGQFCMKFNNSWLITRFHFHKINAQKIQNERFFYKLRTSIQKQDIEGKKIKAEFPSSGYNESWCGWNGSGKVGEAGIVRVVYNHYGLKVFAFSAFNWRERPTKVELWTIVEKLRLIKALFYSPLMEESFIHVVLSTWLTVVRKCQGSSNSSSKDSSP